MVNLAAKTSRLPTYSGLASVLRDLGLCKYSILYDFGAFQFYIGKSSRSHILGEDGHPIVYLLLSYSSSSVKRGITSIRDELGTAG